LRYQNNQPVPSSGDAISVEEGTGTNTLNFDSSVSGDAFQASADASGNGTDVMIMPCYARGTRIKTDEGEVAVEDLRIGDEVATVFSGLRPVKWIGRRAYAGRFLLGRKDMLPVCFKAGSLGENTPVRDLHVSPLHAMYIEKVLIPASALVDGVAVTQAVRRDSVEYFHIELDSHDVIFAEGAASETFLDDDCRNMFQNAPEYATLYGDPTPLPARFCAPRKEDGFEVERARRSIAARRNRAAA